MSFGKLFLFVFILFVICTDSSVSPALNYTIENNTVFVDDTNVYLSATPHTLSSSGWVYFNLTAKTYTGDIDAAWGFNTSVSKPTRAELYNPHWVNTTSNHEHTFLNVTFYAYSGSSFDYGNSYNSNYSYTVKHEVPTYNEITMEPDGFEFVFSNVAFDSFDKEGINNYTIYWHDRHDKYILWKDYTHSFDSINYDYDGFNKWYYIKNVLVIAEQNYMLRAWVDVPVSLSETSGKYYFAVKPSYETISQAVTNGNFYALDPWWDSSWDYYKTLTINQTMVNQSISDGIFQMYVNITDADLASKAQADGDDIVFTNAANDTQLDHQIVGTFNSTTGHLQAYINVTDISNVSFINMYYGNAGATNTENPSGVWGVNASGIWLMDEGTGLYANDSSGNNNNGTLVNGTAWGSNGLDFNEVDGYVNCGNDTSLEIGSSGTFSFWGQLPKWNVPSEVGGISNNIHNNVVNSIYISIHYTAGLHFRYGGYIVQSGERYLNYVGSNNWEHNSSHNLIATWYNDNGTTDLKLYADGVQVDSDSTDLSINFSTSPTWYIGRLENGNYWTDSIDSVYIYNSALSAEEIATRYNNTNSPELFISVGAEQSEAAEEYVPPTPTNLQNKTGNFWIYHNWTAGSGNVTDSYNVSINGTWYNTTTNLYYNNTGLSPHGFSEIFVYAYNTTGDGSLSTNYITDNVTIPNNPITISNISASYTIDEGDILYIDAEATDADSDTPTFADNSTTWNVNTGTGIVSWQTVDGDDGTYYWQINVSDGYDSIDTHEFNVTVNNTIIAPTLSNQSPPTPYYSFVGQNVTFNATSDQASNNEFLLDSVHQTWNNGTSPTYINTTAAIGEYNVTLIAYNTTNSSLLNQFIWTWNVSILQPPQNMTNVTDLDQIHYNWDDYESADYWNISQLDITIPFTPSYPVLDGIEDACYDCCCAHGFVGDSPNPYTDYGKELIYILRNDTYLILYADGEDNDGLPQDDDFSVGIDASNNNLTTDDRKFILNEGGTVTAKRWSGSAWLPQATNAQGVVVGAGTPGAIQYEMFIPVSELDTNFTNGSTVKFFMSRTHTGSHPDIESYYPQTLQNDTDATLWQSVLLSETPQYTYINNTTTSDYTVTGLDPFTWYQHKFVTINGTLESSAVNHVAITLDTPSYSIEGYIKDIFGNFIPNATVYAQNGYVSEMNTSNASGYYSGVHFHNDTYNVYANATGYALNYTTVTVAGANLTNVNVTLTPLQIIPPNPTDLINVTYNHGVGFNWTVGSGNYTDSYNVTFNGTSYNGITNTFINKTVGAHGTAEIIVYAYNSTENGALSAGYLTDNVTVPNNVPVLAGCPDSNTNEDVPINNAFDLDTYYSDVDGDSPSYLVQSNNQTGNVTPSIDGNNVVSYSLAANWYGVAEIVYKVEDGYGANDTDTVIVTVSSVNDPPVLQSIGPQNVNEGQTVTIEVAGTDVETPEVDLDFTCNRTDLFTDFSINGGWTEWITNYSQAGIYHVLFTVTDGTDSDNETVVITVTDIPLTIDSYWNNQTGGSLSLSIDTGTTVAFGVTTNRTANTTWYNHSVFAETDTDTTQANYTATFSSAGTFYINASATDGIDQTANTTFTVEVSVPAVYYNVSGYVFDTNATALSGSTVSDNQSINSTTTNVSGYYVMGGYVNGSYTIEASKSGYYTNTTIANVAGANVENINITLVARPEEEDTTPLSLFITWTAIMFVMLAMSVPRHDDYDNLNIGIPHILFGLTATTISYVNSKQIINGQVVQTFSGISSTDTVIITTQSVQISWLSYVLQFIGIVSFILTMILILAFINEHFMKEIEDEEVI